MNRQAFNSKLKALAANSPEADEFVSDDYGFVMDDQAAKKLGKALKHNTSVDLFDLNITGLRRCSSAEYLSPFLRNNPSLREVKLRGMVGTRERKDQIMDKLISALAKNRHVTNLNLALHDCCFIVPSFLRMLRSSILVSKLIRRWLDSAALRAFEWLVHWLRINPSKSSI